MEVLIILMISIFATAILCAVTKQSFFCLWLSIVGTMLSMAVSYLAVVGIISEGITNTTMFYVIGAGVCWLGTVEMWKEV